MSRIGDSIAKMEPENIVLIAQAGSYLYGLNTPESDVDFIVIYADPVEVNTRLHMDHCKVSHHVVVDL